MRAPALAIAFAVALTAPAMAQERKAAKRKAAPADTMSEAQKTNDASWRLVKGSLPIYLPWWSMPLFMKVEGDKAEEARKAEEAKASRPARKKAAQQ